MADLRKKPVSIGEAARITGVTIKQLRYWQTRNFIAEPEIVVSGVRSYRYYEPEQLAVIRRLKSYLDEGFTLKVAAEKARINRKEVAK